MNAQFGEVYAQSVAKDFVFDKLGGRTVERALADGVDAKAVWRAVCDTFKVPETCAAAHRLPARRLACLRVSAKCPTDLGPAPGPAPWHGRERGC